MALKKSQLYSSLWQSCDELRGGMDASQYKDYVLTLLFMKYVSDKHVDTLIEVPDGGSFADMAKLKGDKEIGDKINKIIGKLAEANNLKGVIDQADFNDESKLGKGKGAIILPHGVLFRGNKEAGIRKNLILRGFIKGIIGLPPNLFYGTGIPACIMIVDKEQAQARLDEQVLAHYAKLTEAAIKSLVVEDKWFADIRTAIGSEVERLTQRLAGRVKELEERYARPLPELEREVEVFSAKVEEHLKRMGLSL